MSATWLLPEGFDEALPDDAWRIESLRRRLLDLYAQWGYDLVMPPLVEFVDSLLTGTGTNLELQTFRFTDQQSGRMLGLRADMTPQVARIDAHRMQIDGPLRLCYIGTVLHTKSDGLGSSRSPLQFGAELYGSCALASDMEVISLMLASLKLAELDDVSLDLGHVAIFRALVERAGIGRDAESELFELLQAKDLPELHLWLEQRRIDPTLARQFQELARLHGDVGILARGRETLAQSDETIHSALNKLEAISTRLGRRFPHLSIHLDLAELRGYHYHTGMVFAAYLPHYGQEIARGGRYDGIGEVFGRARPATGFSADLKTLLAYSPIPVHRPTAVWAPAVDDERLEQVIQQLRDRGQRIVRSLSDAESPPSVAECDRTLVLRNGQWVIEPIVNSL